MKRISIGNRTDGQLEMDVLSASFETIPSTVKARYPNRRYGDGSVYLTLTPDMFKELSHYYEMQDMANQLEGLGAVEYYKVLGAMRRGKEYSLGILSKGLDVDDLIIYVELL